MKSFIQINIDHIHISRMIKCVRTFTNANIYYRKRKWEIFICLLSHPHENISHVYIDFAIQMMANLLIKKYIYDDEERKNEETLITRSIKHYFYWILPYEMEMTQSHDDEGKIFIYPFLCISFSYSHEPSDKEGR
jgi:hypothetical protein